MFIYFSAGGIPCLKLTSTAVVAGGAGDWQKS